MSSQSGKVDKLSSLAEVCFTHAATMATVKSIVFYSWYYFLLATGATSLCFDFRRKRLTSTTRRRYYNLLPNALILGFLPFYYLKGMRYLDAYEEKPLLVTVGHFNIQMQTIIIVYTCVIHHWHDVEYYSIAKRLLHLERRYFERWSEYARGPSYNWLLWLKFFSYFSQNASLIMGPMTVSAKRLLNWMDLLLNLYYFFIWNYLHSIIFSYCLTLLHVVRRYDVLNMHLRRELQRLNAGVLGMRSELSELRRMLQVHKELQVIVAGVNNLYRFHITWLLLIFFLSNTTTFYVGFIHLANWSMCHMFVLLSFSLFAIKSFDIFLINHCCELLVARHSVALELLRRQQHHLQAATEYEQMCVNFGLNATLTKFRINIYGMFDMDHRATFAVLRNTVMHTLILIQFDYIMDAQMNTRDVS